MDTNQTSIMTQNRNVILDLLRIVATIEIFFMHLTLFIPEETGNRVFAFMSKISSRGANGVAVLFCLSGYLIYQELAEKQVETKYFYKKRLKRIIPVYYFVLILYILAGLLPPDINIWRYFFFVNGLVPSHNYQLYNNMGAFWSMGCFMLWYLVAPWYHKKIKNLTTSLIALAGTFLFGRILKIIFKYIYLFVHADCTDYMLSNNPFGNLYFFCLGMTAYYLIKENKKTIGYLTALSVATFLSIINSPWYIFWASITMMFLLLSEDVHIKLPQPVGRITAFLSNISFDSYLIHLGTITYISSRWNRDAYGDLLFVLFATGVTFLLAVFIYYADRLVFQRLLSRLPKNRERQI